MQKILIIRFSSLGDIVQCLFTVENLKKTFPESEIHWLVRGDFAELLCLHPGIDRIWSLHRRQGLKGLVRLCLKLRREGFTHIYDAHNNVRSHLTSFLLCFMKRVFFQRRSKDRVKRFLLLRLRKNFFPQPYRGGISYLAPLGAWGVSPKPQPPPPALRWPAPCERLQGLRDRIEKSVALAPSAAWALKRWPLEFWRELILKSAPGAFVVLGGPGDDFCRALSEAAPDRVLNLAGELSWLESAQVIRWSRALISGDTGTLHIADFLATPVLALIGPSAFGYPSRPSSGVLERPLPCKPCSKDGRGRCRNPVFQRCLRDVSPLQVTSELRKLLGTR